jgi:ribosome-binding factor A
LRKPVPKNNKRLIRINDEIKKELAEILRGGELKDPRIGAITTVLKVETSPDLNYCTVGISVYGDDAMRTAAISAIRNASGFIRKLIAERLDLRQTPVFTFVLDDSLEHGIKMAELIKTVVSE